MNRHNAVQPNLLSKINERSVLREIQSHGPLSRAEVARQSGISAPTVSRAVESLIRAGLLEECDAPELLRGRPAKKLRLSTHSAQVLGLVIDAHMCRLVSAGLDGEIDNTRIREFATPATYESLLDTAVLEARGFIADPTRATLGLAISMPGLINTRTRVSVLSPNVPITNSHAMGRDLEQRLGIACVLVQEADALCLAERRFGAALGVDDFAMLDVSTGVGLGIVSGGRLITGYSGLAGEIGHITVELDGRPCGCGNHGCLETVAGDSALAYAVSQKLGKTVSVREALHLIRSGEIDASHELSRTCRYLAVGVAAVINMLNPSTLFVHGELFSADPGLFESMVVEASRRALPPSFADCRIVQARGSKRQGAIAAVIEYLTNGVAPELNQQSYLTPQSSYNAVRKAVGG
jgi:predicted NBD/HSP70 family sugar kinase